MAIAHTAIPPSQYAQFAIQLTLQGSTERTVQAAVQTRLEQSLSPHHSSFRGNQCRRVGHVSVVQALNFPGCLFGAEACIQQGWALEKTSSRHTQVK